MTPLNCCFEPSNRCSLAGLHPEHQQRERHARTPDVVLGRLWNAISEALFGDTAKSRTHFENVRTWAQIAAPVVWLLGKTGAGKPVIVFTHGRPGRRAHRIDPASPAPGIELPSRAVCGTPRPAAAVCPRRFHPA